MDYELIRSKRRTLGIEVKPDGRVIVRAPRRLSQSAIDKYVLDKQAWIEKALDKINERNQSSEPLEAVTQAEKRELKREAMDFFPERIAFFADKVGVDYERVSYRFQRGRWGSCSSRGNLNFNCMLLLTPDNVIDYVIVHELCHRLEMNHGPRFWQHVERVLPDYKQARDWLAIHGNDLLARLDVPLEEENSRYYTYMVRCADGSLYVGYTDDLEKRLASHNSGTGAKYTKARRPVELVYYEDHRLKRDAMSREAILKQLTHGEKEELVAGFKSL